MRFIGPKTFGSRGVVVAHAGMFGVLFIGALAGVASAQSVNVRFGSAATTPSTSYAGAGLAGAWNSIPTVPPDYQRVSLVGLQGSPIAAQLYQAGSSSVMTFNNPLTSGDDERLMDSMMLSTNSPTDGCFWIDGLFLGAYEVTIYAMTPNEPSRLSRTRVDNGSPGPTMVGGAWPGHHQTGITHAKFTVTTTDGVIAFHDGLAGAVIQSGMNGVQLKFLGSCPVATFTSQPASATTCPTGGATFSVGASGTGPITYQWQWRPVGYPTWQNVASGMNTDPLTGGTAFSATSPTQASVTLTNAVGTSSPVSGGRREIHAVASNPCGGATSNTAVWSICVADTDNGTGSGTCDGGVTIDDLLYYLRVFDLGLPRADVDDGTGTGAHDGGVTIDDLLYYLARFDAGC